MNRQSTWQRGFSLIEAMVALLVIAVGLLGIAGLQSLSVSNTSTSRLRALAAIEASNMAAMISANASYWGGLIGGVNITVQPGVPVHLSDPTLYYWITQNVDCVKNLCNGQQLAAYDLEQWAAIDQLGLLPGGLGVVSCNSVGICAISVGWRQQTPSVNGAPSLAPQITYFRMVMQP